MSCKPQPLLLKRHRKHTAKFPVSKTYVVVAPHHVAVVKPEIPLVYATPGTLAALLPYQGDSAFGSFRHLAKTNTTEQRELHVSRRVHGSAKHVEQPDVPSQALTEISSHAHRNGWHSSLYCFKLRVAVGCGNLRTRCRIHTTEFSGLGRIRNLALCLRGHLSLVEQESCSGL